MRAATIPGFFAAVSVSVTAACASDLTLSGELYGEVVPPTFSGALANMRINNQSAALAVWSTLPDTCGLTAELFGDLERGGNDVHDTGERIEAFFADIPVDFWLMSTFLTTFDGSNVNGDRRLADHNVGGWLCHFTQGPSLNPRGNVDSSCANIDGGHSNADVSIDRHGLSFVGDLGLLHLSAAGDLRTDDPVSGDGHAPACPALVDAFEGFARTCSTGSVGCQLAQTLFFVNTLSQR